MKKIAFGALSGLALLGVVSCGKNNNYEIDIVYTTDVHCAVNTNLGYATLKQYYDDIDNDNKILIDSGDAIQGGKYGSLSKGEYIIDIMNAVGYDCMTIGNHEFDYGIDQLKALEAKANFDFLSCNLEYTGKNENKLSNVKPYDIFEFGKKKIGIIGVSTPFSHNTSTPKYFKEDDEFVYNFTNETVEDFYNCVQDNIDECKDKGCNFVILSTHLGFTDNYSPYSSEDLINNVSGVACVLDGHAHYEVENTTLKDKNGKDVPILDGGTKLTEFGHINIKNGKLKLKLVKEYDKKNQDILDCIDRIDQEIENITKNVVSQSDIDLKIYDEDGVRMSRNRETAMSDLCADALKAECDAQIGIINGGGIKAGLKKGDVTYGDILDIHPYGNEVCVIEATGQQIKDYLEFTTMKAKPEYKTINGVGDLVANGEFGAFPCVSGLKFTLDTTKTSNCEVDTDGFFIKVNGEYRISNLEVLNNGSYEAIDLNKTYTIATIRYVAYDCGDGVTTFKDCKQLSSGKLDYSVLIDYLVSLNGNVSSLYGSGANRINFIV